MPRIGIAYSKFNIYSSHNSWLFISRKNKYPDYSFQKFFFRDTIDWSPPILSFQRSSLKLIINDILTHSFHRIETTIVEKLINHSIIALDSKNTNTFLPVYFLPIRTRSRDDPTTIGTKHSPNIFLPQNSSHHCSTFPPTVTTATKLESFSPLEIFTKGNEPTKR